MNPSSRIPGALGVAASTLGGFFAAFSTHDYAEHLDRQLHGTHCSFLPGITGADTGENACSAAMYSPYSALFKDKLWGGLPISLFALGSFAFFFAMSLYLLLGTTRVSRAAKTAYFVATLAPALASLAMLIISITKLGEICKLCAGIYFSSALLLASGITALLSRRGAGTPRPAKTLSDTDRTQADSEPWHQKVDDKPPIADAPAGSVLVGVGLLALLGIAAVMPAVVYASTLPDYTSRIASCGTLTLPAIDDSRKSPFVKVTTTNPVQPATTIEDPLCPTCRAFHQRLVAEGVYDQLDMRVLIFPLDADCNWLLQGRTLHPGACVLAKAVLCAEGRGNARAVLDWSYDNQSDLAEAGKRDKAELTAKVKQRFPELEVCMASKETEKRLDEVFHFAAENKIRVLTPQLYLGETRVCDEDTDMGLRYAITKLAPKVKP